MLPSNFLNWICQGSREEFWNRAFFALEKVKRRHCCSWMISLFSLIKSSVYHKHPLGVWFEWHRGLLGIISASLFWNSHFFCEKAYTVVHWAAVGSYWLSGDPLLWASLDGLCLFSTENLWVVVVGSGCPVMSLPILSPPYYQQVSSQSNCSDLFLTSNDS